MSDVLTRLTAALESRYRVSREIGAGGMATVYLAHDVRHERDVAIKVLHPDLAAALGAERFLAEIKTTAKLQHPHILPLLDSGEADRLLYYVMPYVAGESLRTRLERETQLGVDDAVRIAREVASALESAHRSGVVHRDIKPENILLHEDQALVADFGIALAVSAAGGPRMTQTGLSLGTPAYMAPEQAMGERAIDARADIYALGAVLYEMLVGEAPFTGPSVQAIVARVMTEQPRPVTGQRRSVPEHVNAAVMRSLEKLPADRFSSASEFNRALTIPSGGETLRSIPANPAASRTHGRFNAGEILPWGIAAAALVVAGASLVRRAAGADERPLTHLSVALPAAMEVQPEVGDNLGISHDGRTLAVAVTGTSAQIVLRDLGTDTLRTLPSQGTSGSVEFSPDGQWLAYGADGNLLKSPIGGGPPSVLASSRWAQIAWVGNERILYTKNYDTGLNSISSNGRDSATLTTPDRTKGELGHWWPQALPDGEHVLFTNYRTPADKASIEVLSLRDGSRKVVIESGYHGRFSKGHIVFVRSGSLLAVPFDPGANSTTGDPVAIPLNVAVLSQNGWAGFAIANDGTFAYLHDPKAPIELSWVDEGGAEEATEAGPGNYREARASPDGKRIAVIRDGDVWIFDRARRLFSRLTRTGQDENELMWTPDGRAVLYARDVPIYDIFRRAADGGSPEQLLVSSPSDKIPTSISPDGKLLIFDHDDEADGIDAISLDGASTVKPRSFIGGPANEEEARFSPDGGWVVYESNESGRSEIFLVANPTDAGAVRQQLSTEGGGQPQWAPDGRSVYYQRGAQIVRVRVNPGSGEIGKPETLTRIPSFRFWSVAPDGRFLIGKPARNSERRTIKVVSDWTQLIGAK